MAMAVRACVAGRLRELLEHVHVQALHVVRVELVELALLLLLRLEPRLTVKGTSSASSTRRERPAGHSA